MSSGCEQLIWDFFNISGGQVVIYDANNGTRQARHTLAEKFHKAGIHVIMLGQSVGPLIVNQAINNLHTETMCDNKDIIETNIRSVKISSPDVCLFFDTDGCWPVLMIYIVSWLGPRQGSRGLL